MEVFHRLTKMTLKELLLNSTKRNLLYVVQHCEVIEISNCQT